MIPPNVRYVPHAIPDADTILARLDDEIVWLDTMKARRTASYGQPYNYSGQVYPAAPIPPSIADVVARAAELAGHAFDNCLCNLYETGHKRMGFHRDSYDELDPDSRIAIASFGATRQLVFRTVDEAHRATYRLEHGSILLMDRETQREWLHAVPEATHVGRRISLTFRRFAEAIPGSAEI